MAGTSDLKPFGPIQVGGCLLIAWISTGDQHFRVSKLDMNSEPFRNVADKTDWNRAFITSETIVDDPRDGRFPGRAFSANDVDPAPAQTG